jgi:hypothetical protein
MDFRLYWKLRNKAYETALRLRSWDLDYDEVLSNVASTSAYKPMLPLDVTQSLKQAVVFIPFRDEWSITQKLSEQILSLPHVRVVLINNQSQTDETKLALKSLLTHPRLSLIDADFSFNFARIINHAVNQVPCEASDLLIFANNDLSILNLERFASFCATALSQERLICGASLFYPSGRVQHLYAQPGVKIVAAHPFKGAKFAKTHDWFKSAHEVPAVSGALLALSKSFFAEIGGFDENLTRVGQDIDLCLRAKDLGGKVIVYSPLMCEHLESHSLGTFMHWDEVALMYQKWGSKLSLNKLLIPWQSRYSEKVLRSASLEDLPFNIEQFLR